MRTSSLYAALPVIAMIFSTASGAPLLFDDEGGESGLMKRSPPPMPTPEYEDLPESTDGYHQIVKRSPLPFPHGGEDHGDHDDDSDASTLTKRSPLPFAQGGENHATLVKRSPLPSPHGGENHDDGDELDAPTLTKRSPLPSPHGDEDHGNDGDEIGLSKRSQSDDVDGDNNVGHNNRSLQKRKLRKESEQEDDEDGTVDDPEASPKSPKTPTLADPGEPLDFLDKKNSGISAQSREKAKKILPENALDLRTNKLKKMLKAGGIVGVDNDLIMRFIKEQKKAFNIAGFGNSKGTGATSNPVTIIRNRIMEERAKMEELKTAREKAKKKASKYGGYAAARAHRKTNSTPKNQNNPSKNGLEKEAESEEEDSGMDQRDE